MKHVYIVPVLARVLYIHVLARVYMHVLVHNRKTCGRGWGTDTEKFRDELSHSGVFF